MNLFNRYHHLADRAAILGVSQLGYLVLLVDNDIDAMPDDTWEPPSADVELPSFVIAASKPASKTQSSRFTIDDRRFIELFPLG
jgi:hypothetical protein